MNKNWGIDFNILIDGLFKKINPLFNQDNQSDPLHYWQLTFNLMPISWILVSFTGEGIKMKTLGVVNSTFHTSKVVCLLANNQQLIHLNVDQKWSCGHKQLTSASHHTEKPSAKFD